VTVNRLCASGLEAVVQATRAARVRRGRPAAGRRGREHEPRALLDGPRAELPKAGNVTIYDTSLGWRYPNPKMEAIFPLEAMGETAENVAAQLGISRADQDAFALASHSKAVAAQAAGAFDATSCWPSRSATASARPSSALTRARGPTARSPRWPSSSRPSAPGAA
jgi:acetyl-CoA acyltransferase